MQVPLPQEQLSAGSAGHIRSGPGVKPMEDVVTGDINRMSTAQLEIASTVLKIDNDLNDAKNRVSQVRSNGFPDAFIFAEKDGERITIKEAIELLNN